MACTQSHQLKQRQHQQCEDGEALGQAQPLRPDEHDAPRLRVEPRHHAAVPVPRVLHKQRRPDATHAWVSVCVYVCMYVMYAWVCACVCVRACSACMCAHTFQSTGVSQRVCHCMNGGIDPPGQSAYEALKSSHKQLNEKGIKSPGDSPLVVVRLRGVALGPPHDRVAHHRDGHVARCSDTW
jgi:hypothetical protein